MGGFGGREEGNDISISKREVNFKKSHSNVTMLP